MLLDPDVQSESTAPERKAGGRTRLSLTIRAPALIRTHVLRVALRVAVRAAADSSTLLLLYATVDGRILKDAVGALPGLVRPFTEARSGVTAGEFVVAVMISLALFGCYGSGDRGRDPGVIARASGAGVAVILWAWLWNSFGAQALLTFVGLWAAVAAAIILERKLIDWIVRLIRPADRQVIRAVVVGPTEPAVQVIDHPAFGETAWCHLAAFFDPDQHDGNQAATLARLIREREIDTVIVTGTLSTYAFAVALDVAAASGCQVFSLPRVSPTNAFLPKVLWRNGYPVFELTRPGVMGTQLLVKRAIDIMVSGAALLVLAPVMAAIALMLRQSSPGPVFFRQTRIGRGGRTFTIVKFRTMVVDAERYQAELMDQSVYQDGRLFKVVDDPRVTPIGAFLRRTSLDELPQLWNVLRGDMSLVGPRPPLPSEVELYQGHHYARFDVKPGLTGPWQVSGRNTIHDFEQVVRLESAYIRRWSLWLDLELLFRTVPVVLSGRGAH